MKSFMWATVLWTAATLPAAEYSTYIGDASTYHIARVLADAAGNTYIAGSRDLTAETSEVFVMKLDPTGKVVVFGTLSGKGSDSATDLAIDAAGNFYVAGATNSPNLPLRNAYQSTPGSGFLAKFSADATQLLYSTYFPEPVSALAVDSAGNAYLAGTTFSTTFPVTARLAPGGTVSRGVGGSTGAYLTKMSATGDRIVYSALLVGHNKDCGAGSSCFLSTRNTTGISVAVDPSGIAYLAGNTDTNDLPVTPGAMLAKGTGAFVASVNAAGTAFQYLTYIGPTYYAFTPFTNPANAAKAIAVDSAGNAYIAGATIDPIFPATKGAFQTTFHGPSDLSAVPDAFVLKLNPTGTAAVWGTYIGGSAADSADSIAIDASGNVWVTGSTVSSDFPNAQGWSQGSDFVVALNSSGTALADSARFPNDTVARSIAVDGTGQAHVAGSTGLVSTISSAQTPAPRIFGIANAAAGNASGRIVPGEIIAIYGPHIGASGAQISIGGVNAPVIFTSDSQINAVVPYSISGQTVAAIHISNKGTSGPDFPAGVSIADPEVFRNPDGYAAALNQDGTVNSSSNPAREGTIVTVWLTGAGFSSALEGQEAQVVTVAQDLRCCEVSVMSSPAEVLYSGTAPGLIGSVTQVNFRLPVIEFFAAQPYLEFTVQAGGQTSLPVRVYVSQ